MLAGGVERVTLNLAHSLQGDGIECRLALRSSQGEWLAQAQETFADVDVIAAKGMLHFVPNLAMLIADWKPTHIITAFSDVGLLTLLARHKSGVRAQLIHGIHNTHAFANRRPGMIGMLRYGLDGVFSRLLYPRADALICVSKGIEAEVKACCPSVIAKTHTIYNPVASAAFIAQCAQEAKRRPRPSVKRRSIIALGRLTRQKGFDVLIDAAARMPAAPDWHIDIYGDGPERGTLQHRIKRRGMQNRITLHHHTGFPHEVLRKADVFVLPSRYEGFGLVLAEAMMHGVQVIAADCPQGPRELLDDGRLGQLVPVEDSAALALALQKVLTHALWTDLDELLHQAARFATEYSIVRWLYVMNGLSLREDDHVGGMQQ